MAQRVATLEIELAMATGGAAADLSAFGGTVDRVSAQAIRDLNRIDAATKNIGDMSRPTAELERFAAEAARSAITTAREMSRIERAGESMASQLERQLAVYGKTAAEIRSMRAEEAAAAADRVGQSELATRIRAKEQALWEAEYAAARRARLEQEAAAEDRETAAAAAAREAQAVRDAAAAHAVFETKVRQGAAALREEEAVQRAAEREKQTAIASTEAYAAKLEAEAAAIGRTASELREMEAAQRAAAADAAGMPEQATRIRAAAEAYSQARAAAAALAAEERQLAEASREAAEAARQAAAAQAAQDASLHSLRSSVDPLYSSQVRLSSELEQAVRLYRSGVIGQEEYERSSRVLASRLDAVRQAQARQNDGMDDAARGPRLAANDLTNILFQLQDIAVSLAGGQNPLLVLMQQGSQLSGIMLQTGVSADGMAKAVLGMLVVTTPTAAAMAALTAATTAQAAAQAAATSTGTASALATAEMTVANEAAAAVAVQNTTAQAALAAAQAAAAQAAAGDAAAAAALARAQTAAAATAVELAAAEAAAATATVAAADAATLATAATAELAAAQQAATAAARAAAASATTALAPWLVAILGIVAALGVVVTMVAAFDKRVEDDANLKAYADTLGLTHKEMKKLGDVSVTTGDMLNGLMTTLGIDLEKVAAEAKRIVLAVGSFMGDVFKGIGAAIYGLFVGSYRAVTETWRQFPAVLGDIFVQAVNAAIGAVEWMLNKSIGAVNALAGVANQVLGALGVDARVGQFGAIDLGRVQNQWAGQARSTGAAIGAAFNGAVKEALAATDGFMDRWAKNTEAAARKRLADEAATIIDNRTDKAAKKAKEVKAQFEKLRDPLKVLEDGNHPIKVKMDFDLPGTGIDVFDMWMGQLDDLVVKMRDAAGLLAEAWGPIGDSIGRATLAVVQYGIEQQKVDHQHDLARAAAKSAADVSAADAEYTRRNAELQVGLYGDLAGAAKGFFERGTAGYKALHGAEQAFRAVQFALSVRAMAQDIAETGSKLATSAARTAAGAVEAVVNAIKSLPFPLNLAAGAATIGALASIGVGIAGSFGGGRNNLSAANDGTGTVLGDNSAKSDSLQRSIDLLSDIDHATMTYSGQMLAALKSIDSKIGGFASLIARAGNIDASAGVNEGFKTNTTGDLLSHLIDPTRLLSKIPIVGDIIGAVTGVIKSLFGTKTTVIGSGLYGGAQTLGDITAGGFDAQYYSDVEKKKKAFGITIGKKYSTQYGEADPTLENQFTLILRGFADAVAASAGPIGIATDQVESRLNGFVVSIGKIDLQGLSGEEVQEKLEAVFGAAADNIAAAVIPGLERFQAVGEGYFETLIRVASTAEAVTDSLDLLGRSAAGLGVDAKMGIAGMFDSVSGMQSSIETYFTTFYTDAEQTAARTAQLGRVFTSLGMSLPSSIAGYRALVDAQDLSTDAGQRAYAQLIQLAPAFADIATSAQSATSAAAILREQQDLQKQLYEVLGDTAALRAAELAQLDPSNRALQQQIWAIQDAKEAAKAAEQLRDAWASVGDSIMDEVRRIRGLTDASSGGGFASLLGQFNVANSAARAGDMDAAKSLPQLSKSLLDAAALAATSRQELDRVQAQTAAALEATYGAIDRLADDNRPATSSAATLASLAASQAASAGSASTSQADGMAELRQEVATLKAELISALATIASNTGRVARKFDDVTTDSGGSAISVQNAA